MKRLTDSKGPAAGPGAAATAGQRPVPDTRNRRMVLMDNTTTNDELEVMAIADNVQLATESSSSWHKALARKTEANSLWIKVAVQ